MNHVSHANFSQINVHPMSFCGAYLCRLMFLKHVCIMSKCLNLKINWFFFSRLVLHKKEIHKVLPTQPYAVTLSLPHRATGDMIHIILT
jgi:hypothetical protein